MKIKQEQEEDAASTASTESASSSSCCIVTHADRLRLARFKRRIEWIDSPIDSDSTDNAASLCCTELRFTLLPPLHEINRHPKDEYITFEEIGHVYWIKNRPEGIVSTTGLLHAYSKGFDPNEALVYVFRSWRYLYDETYKYYKKSKEEILEMWQNAGNRASEEGSANHAEIEKFYNGEVADLTRYEVRELFYNGFYRDHHAEYEPWRTEMLIFNETLRITGSADIIFRNRTTRKLCLMDWKFVKKLVRKNSAKKLLQPLEHLDDCNANLYAMQLSVYRYILETEYGLEGQFEDQQYLIILHKQQSTYKKVAMPYLRHEVTMIFEERKRQVDELRLMSLEDTKY